MSPLLLFEESSFSISYCIYFLVTCLKLNMLFDSIFSFIVKMLGWFAYFDIDFSHESLIDSV